MFKFRSMYHDAEDLSFEQQTIKGDQRVNTVIETILVERDWNAPGIRSLAGLLRFRDYGS